MSINSNAGKYANRFRGSYGVRMDSKNRFKFPGAFREVVDRNSLGLALYIRDEGSRNFLVLEPYTQRATKGGTILRLDGEGRIRIPQRIMLKTNLDKEIVLFSEPDGDYGRVRIYPAETVEDQLQLLPPTLQRPRTLREDRIGYLLDGFSL